MTVTMEIGKFIVAFIAAMGIPSAIMGLIIWRLERRIAKREKEAEHQSDARESLLLQIVQGTNAAIALGEATAKAVQRIPDAHCNGDMHTALEYATEIKRQQKAFLSAQGIHALWDD